MGLSSLFKPKPMISVVLTKETQNTSNEQSDFSSFEARLDKLGCQLQKIKKQSKRVFECNNLETPTAVEECCAKLKKERCKAKKQRALCKTKSTDDDCAMSGGESMEIDDFSCGDQLTLSGESRDECDDDNEVGMVEDEEGCDNEDNGKCDDKVDECEEEEEENECEEEIKKSACRDGEDKCTQVMMTLEPKSSSYLVSQMKLENKYISDPVTPRQSFSSSKGLLKSEKKQDSKEKKTAKTNLTIPVTTMSPKSLSKASCSKFKTCDLDLKGVETIDKLIDRDDSLNKQTLQTYNVQSSSQIEGDNNNKMLNMLSRGKNRSRSLSRPNSKPSIKKEKVRSASASKTPPNSLTSKVNVDYLLKEGTLNNVERLLNSTDRAVSKTSDLNSENKQNSIVYIIQTPHKKSASNMSEGTIHIDASKVIIQNSTLTEVKSGSFVDTTHQKPVILKKQKSSERVLLSEIAATSDKLESRVSFQQPEVIECTEKQSNLLGQIDKSTTSTEVLYDNSSKIISNFPGPTSHTLMASSTEVKSKESSKPPQRSESDVMKISQDKLTSDCGIIKASQAQFVSDCEIYYSNSGKKLLVKGSPKGSLVTSQSREPLSPLTSSYQKPVTNEIESQTLISSLSQNGQPAIQTQSMQFSRSGPEKNSTNKLSKVLSSLSAGSQKSMIVNYVKGDKMKTETVSTESQTQVMQSTLMNSMEKNSLNVLSNIGSAKVSQNNCVAKQMSSHLSDEKVENYGSKQTSMQRNFSKVKDSGALLDHSKSNNSSIGNQEMSEATQQNETIAMFANIVGLPKTRSKDYLVVHCSKCKEVCIAKIIEKTQPQSDIWAGQGN